MDSGMDDKSAKMSVIWVKAFHAVRLPLPETKEAVSQPVKACSIGSALAFCGASWAAISWIARYLNLFSVPSVPVMWYDTTCFARKWKSSVWWFFTLRKVFHVGEVWEEGATLLRVPGTVFSGSRLQAILPRNILDDIHSLMIYGTGRYWQHTPEMFFLSQATSFALQQLHWLWSRQVVGILKLLHTLDTFLEIFSMGLPNSGSFF